MGSKICMNELCRATTSSEWKKGWGLKSGGFAILCYSCGSAYENSVFCESFHQEESGWRECRVCRKRIHCGCIASRFLHEYMDFGGVGCINCAKHMEIHLMQSMQIPGGAILNGTFVTNGIGDVNPTVVENRINDENFSIERLPQLTKTIRANKPGRPFHSHKLETLERNKHFSSRTQRYAESSAFTKPDNSRPKQGVKDAYESVAQPHLNISLNSPLGGNSSGLPFATGNIEGSEQIKGSFDQGQRSGNIVLKPPALVSEQNRGTARVARPPAEGRGRNQLLPRYWPRITEQELQKLSGDLKSPIIPLFEKVLSASDAGRIGRLVLPKACAEAYFPIINQSEGIPIRIQDIKGNEWTFQFRFWPNNNSRMYVLEGVTPCIQSLQVQAGDTVTFSRRDPGGQLVIGCRKATAISDMQDSQMSTVPHGGSPGEMSVSHADYLLQNGGKTSDDSMQWPTQILEKKKMKNIKNKRLLMHSDEAMELRVTWEEAQDLFRPCPSSNPTVVMIEDHAFEEFEEPPIFGKRTFSTSSFSGEQEQLVQCDSCSKWRRLPFDALLSAKWMCSENIWDSNRCSCAAPEDINPRDLDAFFRADKGTNQDNNTPKDGEPSGLDALATAAVLGDNMGELGESSAGVTTKHPRHRPGCSCIVCIQPPSGKGKHQPACKCNVCLTVRRRFKTLMMRKKKRQSEQEAELLVQAKDKAPSSNALENEEIAGHALLLRMIQTENAAGTSGIGNQLELAEANKGRLDLNSDPHHEDDMLEEAAGMSLTTLINAASLPMDMYFGPNGVGPGLLSQAADESDGYGEGGIASGNEAQNKGEDG